MATTTFKISKAAQQWLETGERGISSEAIFSHLTGLNISGRWGSLSDTPSDPADLRRCMLLLDAVPEFAKQFNRMKTRSEPWRWLVENWDMLTEMFISEAGEKWKSQNTVWSAPKTLELMRTLRRQDTLCSNSNATPSAQMSKLSEADLQVSIIELAHVYGWRVACFRKVRVQRKNGSVYWETPVGADGKGWPDLCLVRNGQKLFVELKSATGRVEPDQAVWLELLGGIVWGPKQWFDGTVERALK